MSNPATVVSPGEGFGGASQREEIGGSQENRVECKLVTKEEQAEVDKLKQEMQDYKAKLDAYKAKLKGYEAKLGAYKAELKEHKAAGRMQEAQHCEGIVQQKGALIQELYAGIRKKEALIQQLFAGIQQNEEIIQEKETRKRKNPVDPDDSGLVVKFLKTVPKAAVEGKLVRFEMNLFCQYDTPNALIVRDWYDKIYSMILERVQNHEGLYTPIVRVTGTPGTGKTVCGIYVVRRLLLEFGATVLYLHQYDYVNKVGEACLLGPKDSEIIRRACSSGHVVEKKNDDEYWWGAILTETPEGQELLDFLLEETNLWCVLDAGQRAINVPGNIGCNLVVFSSPHPIGTINKMSEKEIVRYMPLWSIEELVAANKLLELGIDEAELDDRFAQFGGVAGWVLAKDFRVALEFYEETIDMLRYARARDVLNPFSNDYHCSSVFVHIVPRNGLKSMDVRVSTELVLKHVQMQFTMEQQWDMQKLMTVMECWGVPGIKAEVHEMSWHRSLMLGLKNCRLRDLDSVKKRTSGVDVPALQTPPRIFSHKNMCDILELEEGQYCMQLHSNFDTIASWVVMHNPFVDGNNDNLCLVQFQMTTAQEHDLLQDGELRVIRKNEELFKVRNWEGKNIYIVFIVQEEWFNQIKKQEWKDADRKKTLTLKDKRLGDIRQFALCVPKEAIRKRPVVESLNSRGISFESY